MSTPSDGSSGPPSSGLQRTPLFDDHCALGARMVEFGGWEMPVQYTSIVSEHRAVRTAAGLFDVSHMGEFRVAGSGALDFLEGLVPNHVGKLAPGQALYTQLCRPDGGTVDDLLIYSLTPDDYLVVVNAGTMPKDWAWFTAHAAGRTDVTLENRSAATALIALQGPRARAILAPLTATDLNAIRYYHAARGDVAGIACLISRTGYTGEDGFELYHPAEDAPQLWRALLAAGTPLGLLPAGLGARDTLRLEAGYCLYDHELTEAISPLEADLGWSVKLKKGRDFVGRAALQAQKDGGLARKRVGLLLPERAIVRAGAAIRNGPDQAGVVTSGTLSISLGRPIAMGYVPPWLAPPGTQLHVELRGKLVAAEVAPLPFYKRPES